MDTTARYWAVLPAAGLGSRIGGDRPKQYQLLAGRPMIEHAIEPILQLPGLAAAVVALAAGDQFWSTTRLAGRTSVETVVGGAERCLSVLAALRTLDGRAAAGDWVLVHDVARPCLNAVLLAHLVDTLRDDAVGGLLAIPVADTLKSSRDGLAVDQTVDRSTLWRAQTPQQFRFGALLAALEAAARVGRTVTDEAQAMEAAGLRPRLVTGDESNIKVTRSADLALAEYHLGRSP